MDEGLITQWSVSRRASERIASAFARKIACGQLRKWQQLPDNTATAVNYDVNRRTVIRAKQLLAREGAAKKVNGVYVVIAGDSG